MGASATGSTTIAPPAEPPSTVAGQRGQNHERRIRTYSVKRERNTSKPYKKEKTK